MIFFEFYGSLLTNAILTLETFKRSLKQDTPLEGISVHLQALWYDAKGNWHHAHSLIDHLEDKTSAHVHAYLHRKEGDLWNANYWYNRAKQVMPTKPLEEEWEDLLELLSK
ncbi:hypothetical protein [Olivibacter domesticus]|uniref:Uncharacterized protein n=1 Tax=Olivibacter domesticus TaxID=407022 RepID=A0A1H7QKR6_OLID1|nr:hypothetical protein SAMN05661044_02620 [Olivibacter domesticus]